MLPFLPQFDGPIITLIALTSLWGVAWKGVALWRAAQRHELTWFVVLLIVNAAGTVETFYLFKKNQERWRIWPLIISIILLVSLLFTLFKAVPSGTMPLTTPIS